MAITSAIIGAVAPKVIDVVDQFITDKDQAAKLKGSLLAEVLRAEAEERANGTQVVTTEAQGESSLQRNWRPITMLFFLFLIGAYWFGFVPENMPEAHVSAVFTLVQIGLGGYVVGRSGEKIARYIQR